MGVPPKSMVYKGKSHLEMDDLGVPPFQEASVYMKLYVPRSKHELFPWGWDPIDSPIGRNPLTIITEGSGDFLTRPLPVKEDGAYGTRRNGDDYSPAYAISIYFIRGTQACS